MDFGDLFDFPPKLLLQTLESGPTGIATTDDEAELMGEIQESKLLNIESKINSTSSSYENGKALFRLKNTQDLRGKQINTVHGVFLYRDSWFFVPTIKGRKTAQIECEILLPELISILEYFVSHDLIAILKGIDYGRCFMVNELHSAELRLSDDVPFSGVSDIAFQVIISRISGAYLSTDSSIDKYLINNEDGLKLLYSSIKTQLSEDKCSWIESNFSRLETLVTNRDERNHTLRALSTFLNIDWQRKNISMLPYSAIATDLEEAFFGLDIVKTRILEVVSQIRRCGKLPQWGVLLSGPAGVGKTSIAKKIADILNRPLVTLDLSTINDAESLAGSSRIYSNAKPGLIVEKLLSIRDSNCVFLLNEIDKSVGGKERGNPTDALLTLVDKMGFIDNFLETPIDTSNAFFVATCNEVNRVSAPLLDRFLVINIDGYSAKQKKVIFSKFVLPRILSSSNVSNFELQVTEEFVEHLSKYYATEPGVRDLEKLAERIVGDYLLRCERDGISSYTYSVSDLIPIFGRINTIRRNVIYSPGMASTIICYENKAYNALLQATCVNGVGNFTVYGASSEYHKDCCAVAYSCAKKITKIDFSRLDISLYITSVLPHTTKNYLGCAAFMAIFSAASNRKLPEGAVFLGGCDLLGNLFWDDPSLSAAIKCAEMTGYEMLCGPVGLAEMASATRELKIIESYNAAILFEASVI